MQEWRTITGDVKPEELDVVSSPSTVYERRNIQEETYAEQDSMTGKPVIKKRWVYEERAMTPTEYQNTKTMQQIMQAISDSEMNMTMAIVDTTEMLATENADTTAEGQAVDKPAEAPTEEQAVDSPNEEQTVDPLAEEPAEGGTEDEQNV